MLPLQLQGVSIAFPNPPGPPRIILRPTDLVLPAGAMVGLEGPSGAGKTSLLHALAGLEPVAGGSIRWGAENLAKLDGAARARWRRRHTGLVFQDFHLIEGLSVLDNVLLPVWFDMFRAPRALRDRARALLVGMGLPMPLPPLAVLSRGERQRVALARAVLRQPPLLLADEPTASLDAEAAAKIGSLLVDLATTSGATLIVASHDPHLLARLPIRLRIAETELERLA